VDGALIERLARLRGVGDAYHDFRGALHYFSLGTKAGILRAMGCAVDDAGSLTAAISALEVQRSRGLLPPVVAAQGARIAFDINVAARDLGASLIWSLLLEDGTLHEGSVSTAACAEQWRGETEGTWVTRRRFELPRELPPGYHQFDARLAGGEAHRSLFIVSPPLCHEPPPIVAGRRLWGLAVQLYTVRSRSNWGIGDFGDLQQLIKWLAPRGAGFIGLNPLHALAPADPLRASPYSASSRHFLNILYIAVPEIAEFKGCDAARARAADPAFAARLAALRAKPLVDYAGVAAAKLEVLGLLYRDFCERHLGADSERAANFRAFVAAGGRRLQMHALFDALDRHFHATRGCASGWLSWPEEYRDPLQGAAERFAREYPRQVEFHLYLQWLAHGQLTAAQSLARSLGMPIGLYGDYAVGANPSGSETWADQTTYRMGAEIGAPPDPLALKGQGWGIPPPDPVVLEARHLQGFVKLIGDNMRYYGALRLDHVMSLFRLWWVPAGSPSTDGAYVHYPLNQLLTVLALESARNACLVVGEDLGVVPDEMRVAMPQFGLYHYKVMLFEKQEGRFRGPHDYPRRALATVTTHDMPTLRSYWEGRDIGLRERLNLFPSAQVQAEILRERGQDRVALLAALREQGLAPARPSAANEPFTPELALALHLYLARSGAALAAVQIEDLLGMTEPVNVPGTYHEYPNWQRKLTHDVEDIIARVDLDAQFAAIGAARLAAPQSGRP
jgi:4-alpha-glucanotransferase